MKYRGEIPSKLRDDIAVKHLLQEESQRLIKIDRGDLKLPDSVWRVWELDDEDRKAWDALDHLIDYHGEQMKLAFSGEGCIGGEGMDLAEWAMDFPGGVGAWRQLGHLKALGEMRAEIAGA